jgi:hypothetical protein
VVSTFLGCGTYATAGLVTGWRCGRIVAGTAVSLFMPVVATAVSIIEALIVAALLSAGALHPSATYGGLSEGLDLPLAPMLFVGIPLACIGAAIGKAGWYMPRVDVR